MPSFTRPIGHALQKNNIWYDKRLGGYIEDRPASGRCLEPFIGDLDWLQPTYQASRWQQQEYFSEIDTNRLKAQAAELGVGIPEAFLTLMRSEGLQHRIEIIGGGTYMALGGGLRQCMPSMQDGGEAYIISFYNDQKGCGYTSLYLDAGAEKGHCVLLCDGDLNSDDADEGIIGSNNCEHLEGRWAKDLAAEMKTIIDKGQAKLAWTQKEDVQL